MRSEEGVVISDEEHVRNSWGNEKTLAIYLKDTGMAAGLTHPLLPEMHHAFHPSLLPLHTNMQRVCPPGYTQARTYQGTMARHLANTKMQPLGRLRLRPSAIKSNQLKSMSRQVVSEVLRQTIRPLRR